MTTEEIAKKRFYELNVEVQKCETFVEFLKNYKCHNVTDSYADLNYRECCFTITNDCGKPVLCKSVEVYDKNGNWLDLVRVGYNIGDCVIWHDPDETTRDLTRIWAIDKINGEVITISDDFSEAEVYENEIELL